MSEPLDTSPKGQLIAFVRGRAAKVERQQQRAARAVTQLEDDPDAAAPLLAVMRALASYGAICWPSRRRCRAAAGMALGPLPARRPRSVVPVGGGQPP